VLIGAQCHIAHAARHAVRGPCMILLMCAVALRTALDKYDLLRVEAVA